MLDELAIREARRDFLAFGELVFPEVESGAEYEITWYLQIMRMEIVKALKSPEQEFLAFQLPPRHSKSQTISRLLPAWLFGDNPTRRVIASSYGQDLANKMSQDVQKIMMCEAYGRIFPETRVPVTARRGSTAKRNVSKFDLIDHRGGYMGRGVGGGITGHGGDIIIIDDPVKDREQAESETYRNKVWDWYTSVLRTRLMPGGCIFLLMTRWHEDDLLGRILKQSKENPDADQWKVISFPAIAEDDNPHKHSLDKRKEGEALWPDQYPVNVLKRIKATVGTYDWNALFQQRPSPPGGHIIKREWFQITDKPPADLRWVRFYDPAVSEKEQADYTASVSGAVDAYGNLYLRSMIRGRWSWPKLRQLIIRVAKIEQCHIGVEVNATQKGLFDDLAAQKEMRYSPLTGYTSVKSKLVRALPWITRAEMGKVFLVNGPWVEDFIDECVKFTGNDDEHDDQVDAVSGVWTMLAGEEAIADLGNVG